MTLRETVVAGCSASTFAGGGIFHEGSVLVGHVVLIDSVARDNRANVGGGIDNSNGELTLIRTRTLLASKMKAGACV